MPNTAAIVIITPSITHMSLVLGRTASAVVVEPRQRDRHLRQSTTAPPVLLTLDRVVVVRVAKECRLSPWYHYRVDRRGRLADGDTNLGSALETAGW